MPDQFQDVPEMRKTDPRMCRPVPLYQPYRGFATTLKEFGAVQTPSNYVLDTANLVWLKKVSMCAMQEFARTLCCALQLTQLVLQDPFRPSRAPCARGLRATKTFVRTIGSAPQIVAIGHALEGRASSTTTQVPRLLGSCPRSCCSRNIGFGS